ncbi:MAG: carbonic anhydrase [Cyanophyceae cyanobacterium]
MIAINGTIKTGPGPIARIRTHQPPSRSAMKKLIKGLRQFQSQYFSSHQDLFEQLAHGQKPQVLFIACSDSRVDPNLIVQAEPGEIFVLRNAGNIVPPYGAANGGEGATIEYAIAALGVSDVIVCGHSHCGAMKGLFKLKELSESMPLVCHWLNHAEATRRVVLDNYTACSKDELAEIAVAENVLTQIDNLRTYPIVRSRLNQGLLRLHAWVYEFETGEVYAYDPIKQEYVSPERTWNQPTPAFRLPHQVATACDWLPEDQADRIYRGSH